MTAEKATGIKDGSTLYRKWIRDSDDELMHQVWDGTPWVVDAYTDSIGSDRYYAVMKWCRDKFGAEAWPIHGKSGTWHSGNATVMGRTWMGFATRDMMRRFTERWTSPKPEEAGR